VFIAFNFLSAYYITTAGIYNGDFQGIPLVHSYFEVWGYACIASIPYLILYYIISRVAPISATPIILPKLFVLFVLTILVLSLVLTLTYGVGMVAQGIYSIPAPLKPIAVLINRIDPVVIAGILILSPYVKFRTALLAAGLLLLITLARGSLQYVPFTLLVCFYRFISQEKRLLKAKETSKLTIYTLFFIIAALLVNFAPKLYEFRESIRGIENININYDLYEFIFGKLIGRLSNLPALLMFDGSYDLFYQRIDELQPFAYLLDCLKYFWGSFIKTPVMSHYVYYTSIRDADALGFYAMQTGVLPAMGLSWMKSPIIMVFDIAITGLSIFYTVRLSTFFLGYSGKYLAMSLLIFAVLSGAPSQFSLPIFHLAVVMAVFSIIKYFAMPSRKRS
jgi:hypothetical protein